MKISELVLADLRMEHATYVRYAAAYREKERASIGPLGQEEHARRSAKADSRAEEYAVLISLAQAHNADPGEAAGPLPVRVARLLEKCDREESGWTDSGVTAYLTTSEIRMILRLYRETAPEETPRA
jgi:hypothetical protein